MTAGPPSQTPRLLRAGLIGLGAALLIGGLYLSVLGVRSSRAVDCAELSPDECTLAQQGADELARSQSLSGAALAMISTAIFLSLHFQHRREHTQAQARREP